MSTKQGFRRREATALALLSAAMMTAEITLTRVFAVAQFYHFAFMIISLVLLGLGAAGTLIALFPRLTHLPPGSLLWATGTGFAVTTLLAFATFNAIPFDPFGVAWDPGQWFVLAVHVFLFTLPFMAIGVAVAVLLEQSGERGGMVYGLNLGGAALGALLALSVPSFLQAEGTLLASATVAALAAVVAGTRTRLIHVLTAMAVLLVSGWLAAERPGPFQLYLSPYKALPQALQYPGARVTWQGWNAFSRIDLVKSSGIRSLPGLSIRYTGPIPEQRALFWDGDNPSPVLASPQPFPAAAYMPLATAFVLRPRPNVLVLSARGGLDVAVALTLGARQVWAVEANPLVVQAAESVYRQPVVQVVLEGDRAFLQRTDQEFDLIVFSLTAAYRPVRSGAYSLAEDYRYTVEAFTHALGRLKDNGVLVVTRWLQTPPSEWVRAFALAVAAVEQAGGDPKAQIVAFRGYNTGTLLVQRRPFTQTEVTQVREFLETRGWDLVWAPGMRPEWANRYNVLPSPVYYRLFSSLLNAADREQWFAQQPFDVRPPTDNRPFFEHYFRWRQAGEVWQSLGKTWAPFGGAGYFVVLATLLILSVMALLLILVPLAAYQRTRSVPQPWPWVYPLSYFSALGLGFLFVEIPLIQLFILYLNQPIYAFTTVLIALLTFGAVGSWRWGRRLPGHTALWVAFIAVVMTFVLPWGMRQTLGWPLWARGMVTVLGLAPLATVMGMPFPRGLYLVSRGTREWIPWVWAINAALSVVASPLATLLALTWGFRTVLIGGVLAYWVAWISAQVWERRARGPVAPPAR